MKRTLKKKSPLPALRYYEHMAKHASEPFAYHHRGVAAVHFN